MRIIRPHAEVAGLDRPGVVQVIDSLTMGGAEKVAVDLANCLPRANWRSWICATRAGGALAASIQPHVGQLHPGRRSTFDPAALSAFTRFLKQERISIVHAHSSSLFFGTAAALLTPGVSVIWHDHFGRFGIEERSPWPYKIAFWKASAAIGVTQALTGWARTRIGLREDRARFIPNFAVEPGPTDPASDLPGPDGKRIVMVGNLRPQKNHRFVIETMSQVAAAEPDAVLLFVGTGPDEAYTASLHELSDRLGLREKVHFLGLRTDIHAILLACDLAVLGSSSEGLPIALLEYGMAGRAAVSTDVGQCADVLDRGQCGILVPPGDPVRFAEAIIRLLRAPEERGEFGRRLYNRIQKHYSQAAVMEEIISLYGSVSRRQS